MKAIDIPTKTPIPFARDAAVGYTNVVPQTPSGTPGKAAYTVGFSELNFQPEASGGIPPWGADFNGLLNVITAWQRWVQAGGLPVAYDATFQGAVGGYPAGALLQRASLGYGQYWLSSADDNTSNPETGGANWVKFPDALIQIQGPNYAADTSAVPNQVVIALSRVPASYAEIVGSPIRVKIANANTVTDPVININALGSLTMVNVDSTPLAVGQLIVDGIMEGYVRDDGNFQVSSPAKSPSSPAGSWPPAGFIMPWANETVPAGFLEMNGSLQLISSYPNLYAVLLTRYGGDGVNTFALPDWRGEFVRGWDHGRGLDPDRLSRTNAGGGITGDHVGTNQAPSVNMLDIGGTLELGGKHNDLQIYNGTTGTYVQWNHNGGSSGTSTFVEAASAGTYPVPKIKGSFWPLTSDHAETRPVNVYAMWVIFTG